MTVFILLGADGYFGRNFQYYLALKSINFIAVDKNIPDEFYEDPLIQQYILDYIRVDLNKNNCVKDIVDVFKEASIDIAQMIAKLHEHIGHFERIEDITLDDGAPSFTGHEAMEALGNVLASCVTYADEYEKDPYINPNLKEHSNE